MKLPPLAIIACIGLAVAASVSSPVAAQAPAPPPTREAVRLANDPALSPDGKQLAFSWAGDIWIVPIEGGLAQPLTRHPGRDREPVFAPSGKELAFTSDRDGSSQVYVVPIDGGTPAQLTFHTAGYSLEGYFPDGNSLLVSARRDHFWKHSDRFFRIRRNERVAEELLFDDAGRSGSLSPDGKQLLFTREGIAWWRKGYRGSQASQIWLYDLEAKTFTQILARDTSCSSPLWRPDGKAFYYVGHPKGHGELFEYQLEAKQDRQLTRFEDDTVAFPTLSRDGSTIVFRHLFDFYRLKPAVDEPPAKIEIVATVDRIVPRIERRIVSTATDVSFLPDGLELAIIAGHDLWVMDTELGEPRQVTATAEEERDPIFAPDGSAIYFASDREGQSDLWKAERGEANRYWFLQPSFKLTRLTNDADQEGNLKLSPDGTRLAYVRGRGDLWIMDVKSGESKRLVESWNRPDFDWSPDSRWIAYAKSDDDFNRDVWIVPSDGAQPPVNVSRHPSNDGNPTWSPDGRILAFVGRRQDNETDIFYAWLQAADEQIDRRDRQLRKAQEKLERARRRPASKPSGDAATDELPVGDLFDDRPDVAPAAGAPGDAPTRSSAERAGSESSDQEPTQPPPDGSGRTGFGSRPSGPPPKVTIDFDGLHERLHRISIPSSQEGGLFWSPDSKKLAFFASVDGKRGTYAIEFPENLRPSLLSSQTGANARWLANGSIVWLANGVPGALSSTSGQGTSYRFRARQEVDVAKRNLAAFDLAWRTMRDMYYDERLGNRNWDAIRRKYADQATAAVDVETLGTVISLMLGELNGSHLGFMPSGLASGAGRGASPQPEPPATLDQAPPSPAPPMIPTPPSPPATPDPDPSSGGPTGGSWRPTTKHLGLRFDREYKGPGLKVRDVLPDSPADQKRSKIAPGEIVVSISGVTVDPAYDLTQVLNTAGDEELKVVVRNEKGEERTVMIRPVSYTAVSNQLYQKWIRDNRAAVTQLSGGKLGYLHISGMSMPSFYRFEQELYEVGAGKEGLVIDVRENPGGSTADHLLTALTQPTHAITVPRGGGPGYPQDRMVYAVWNKPIVVLCNQNSFSNAEIFSHAIKTLQRGKLVGVPTAGGVISTGAATILDVGTLRLPFRGWYLPSTGEDMELNGAVPDVIVWPAPGDLAAGRDSQLAKAVEVLQADVKQWNERPRPKLRKASER